MIASLRKILALLLLAVLVGIGLPTMPFAGGQDDPGYTGIPGEDPGDDGGSGNDEGTTDPPGSSSAGKDGQPERKSGSPLGGESLAVSPLPGWLVDLLGVLIRVR